PTPPPPTRHNARHTCPDASHDETAADVGWIVAREWPLSAQFFGATPPPRCVEAKDRLPPNVAIHLGSPKSLPGEIVPQSGVYTITHDPVHADMPHEVTLIKGRRFPTCRHCKVSRSSSPPPPSTFPRSSTSRRRVRRLGE